MSSPVNPKPNETRRQNLKPKLEIETFSRVINTNADQMVMISKTSNSGKVSAMRSVPFFDKQPIAKQLPFESSCACPGIFMGDAVPIPLTADRKHPPPDPHPRPALHLPGTLCRQSPTLYQEKKDSALRRGTRKTNRILGIPSLTL